MKFLFNAKLGQKEEIEILGADEVSRIAVWQSRDQDGTWQPGLVSTCGPQYLPKLSGSLFSPL